MNLKRLIIRHIETNLFRYIIVLGFFVAGVVVGVANSFGTATETTDIVSSFENLSEAEFDSVMIMKTSFFKNLRYFLLIFIGGFSFWLLPFSFSALFTCGFSYGYTVACMTAQMGGPGFAIAFASIAMGLIVTVPLCTMLCVFAVNRNVDKKRNRQGQNTAGYFVCGIVLLLVNLIVVPADSFVVPEIIRQICASVKL